MADIRRSLHGARALPPLRSAPIDVREKRSFWEQNRATYHGARTADLLVPLVGRYLGTRILDAGAGDGSLVRALRRRAPEAAVAGIDLAPKNADVEAGDLTRLPQPDGSLDTVFCSEVIEHAPPEETAAILDEIARVLRPGGHLVLTTPWRERLEESLVTCPGCARSFHRWGHLQSFDEEDFARLATAHGFDPVEIFPVHFKRAKRYAFLGPILRSRAGRGILRGSHGKRTLVMVARRRG